MTGASSAADFPPPVVTAPAGDAPSPDALANAELAMSLTALKYARYARGGRIADPATQLSSYLDRKPQLLEPKTVIEQLAAAGEADAYLRKLHPQQPEFEKLRQKLIEMRTAPPRRRPSRCCRPGRSSCPGASDPQVAIAAPPPESADAGCHRRQAGRRELLRRRA